MNDREFEVKKFWDEQARQHAAGQEATNEDTWYRSLEIKQIIKALGHDPGYVLDVGCGNGFSTKKFAKKFTNSFFEGVDFSARMIKEAVSNRELNSLFFVGNVLDLSIIYGDCLRAYDAIISGRCLINLASHEEQRQAVLQLKRLLADDGKLILVENTFAGLHRLNKLRRKAGLHLIQLRWHNLYLDDGFESFLREHFEHVECKNIGSLYYFLSRVVYAKYAQWRGIKPDYNNWMNRIACKLPVLGGWWASPNMMYVCSGKKS